MDTPNFYEQDESRLASFITEQERRIISMRNEFLHHYWRGIQGTMDEITESLRLENEKYPKGEIPEGYEATIKLDEATTEDFLPNRYGLYNSIIEVGEVDFKLIENYVTLIQGIHMQMNSLILSIISACWNDDLNKAFRILNKLSQDPLLLKLLILLMEEVIEDTLREQEISGYYKRRLDEALQMVNDKYISSLNKNIYCISITDSNIINLLGLNDISYKIYRFLRIKE